MRRLPFTLPVLSLLAVLALAGCRAEPSVAAYVQDGTISTDQLDTAIEQRLADPNISAAVEPGDADYQRLVLNQLVQQEIYRILSADYDVAVSERAIDTTIEELLSAGGSRSVQDEFVRLASEQKLAEIDVREITRQLLIREQIAAEEGLDGPTQEPALMQRYEETKDQMSTIELGFITVPDQESADTVLETLLADPSSYPAVAASYPGPNTATMFLSGSVADLPAQLAPSVLQTPVGQGFTLAVPEAGGIVVGYVASLQVPSFEEVRDQLLSEAAAGVDEAARQFVAEAVADLDIDINPRYGTFDEGQVVPDTGGGVVRDVDDLAPSPTGTP